MLLLLLGILASAPSALAPIFFFCVFFCPFFFCYASFFCVSYLSSSIIFLWGSSLVWSAFYAAEVCNFKDSASPARHCFFARTSCASGSGACRALRSLPRSLKIYFETKIVHHEIELKCCDPLLSTERVADRAGCCTFDRHSLFNHPLRQHPPSLASFLPKIGGYSLWCWICILP